MSTMNDDFRREGLVLPYNGIVPRLGREVFLAPGTIVVGKVEIGDEASLWYNTVVRADVHEVKIGARTNLQDGTVVHVTGGRFGTYIGNDILIGHPNWAGVDARGDEARNVSDVSQQISATLVGNGAEALPINNHWIGGVTGNDDLWFSLDGELLDSVVIEQLGFGIDKVGNTIVELTRTIGAGTV